MKTRLLIIGGLVALLAGGAGLAAHTQPGPGGPGIGQRRGPGGPGGPRGFTRDLGLRGLDLTDAQRDQVRAIMETHREAFQQIGTRLRDAHRGMAQAAQADAVNEAEVRTRSTEVAAAMADQVILRARVRGEVLALLTPEQKQQLAERAARAAERMKERGERLQQRRQRPPQQ